MSQIKRQIGMHGEAMAESYLLRHGYRIICRNFSSHYGEIDLVATQKKRLFFVEVKRRRGSQFGSALEAVTKSKQEKIKKTAKYFLLSHEDYAAYMPFFSVLAIDESADKDSSVSFIPDAFI